MNARVKKLWLKALRSGEYKQAQYTLRDGMKQTYCCLGVLCQIHHETVGGKWSRKGDYLGSAGVLPLEVMQWAKIESDNPEAGHSKTLAGLNDSGKDFNYIADRIEKYL